MFVRPCKTENFDTINPRIKKIKFILGNVRISFFKTIIYFMFFFFVPKLKIMIMNKYYAHK